MNKFFIFLALLAILAPCCFAANIGFMKDPRDGQIYKTVKIGSQTWMAENLNYETEKEILSFPGDIFGGKEFYFETFTSSCYDDRFSNCTRYGRLYKWPDVLNACPAGWHLPSHAEWNTLFATVGGKDSAGKVLKSVDGWLGGGNGSDSYGFSAIPVGYRGYADFSEFFGEVADENLYINEGRDALFWSSTELDSNNAYVVYMFYYKSKAEIVPDYKRLGLSIRCVEDSALVPDSGSKAGMTEKATLLSSSRVSMNSTTSSSSSVTLSRVEGSLTDPRDGQTYKTVKIGSQTWLAQNMNYKAAIPSKHSTEMIINTRKFINSIDRMSLLLNERMKSPIRCRIDNGIIKTSCHTALGQAYDEFEADIQGEDLEIGFDNRYMLDALKNTDTDEIKIHMNGPLSPIVILPVEDDSFIFLVLPVRLRNEN